jgi:hypothetical protein
MKAWAFKNGEFNKIQGDDNCLVHCDKFLKGRPFLTRYTQKKVTTASYNHVFR